MNLKCALILFSLILSQPVTQSARILAVFPIFAVSHHMIIQPILRTLAEGGHEVVVYSPFPLKTPQPNYTDVLLDTIPTDNINYLNEFVKELIELPYWRCLDNLLHVHDMLLDQTFGNENIKILLDSKEQFDLVITEAFVSQEFTFVFGHKFNVPIIGVQTFITNNLIHMNMGNTLSIASIPEVCFPHSNEMTFWQRFMNAFSILRGYHMYYNQHLPMVERKMRKHLPNMPPLPELIRNVSLMFVNDHLTADYPQPRTPNIIPIGGIHIEPAKPLPRELKQFMDEASHGVILLSLGTMVPDDLRPKEFYDSLVTVFRDLPQRVIWKTRKTNIEGLSNNVKLVQWMPQRDVLAHPNCVLFITHGGLASLIETIYNAVPVIGIPYFADQHRNVGLYVAKGVGARIMPNDITEETLGSAIRTVLGNPKYKENMNRLSEIFRDTPMTPKQSVLYWTEYVIRHGGAPHLTPTSVHLAWYQRALLDVAAVIVAAAVTVISVLYVTLRTIIVMAANKSRLKLGANKKSN